MDFTLDQLLTFVGRLDDGPGFDTPRERYRRLLAQRMIDLDSARAVIQQCRERSGEQSHRALQDVVTLCGRFLKFETSFGRYQHDPGVVPHHGTWHSRHRLHVSLILCTDQTSDISLDAVSQAIANGDGRSPRIALLVVTPLYAAKNRLEPALGDGRHPHIRLISIRGLVRLCEMVASGQLAHEDVLQLLNPAVSLDTRLDLLERVAGAGAARPVRVPAAAASPSSLSGLERERRHWVNVMRPDPLTQPERVVDSLMAMRQIRINPAPGLENLVRAGDAICVFVVGRGVVAHAVITAILTDGSRMLRDAKRFTHVLRLTDVSVYDRPVVPHLDLARKLDLALAIDETAVTTPISSREFDSITSHALSAAG